MSNPPKWIQDLYDTIYKIWNYHGVCSHINFKNYHDKTKNLWGIKAAPIYQMIYGGENDGKKMWTGFSFDLGDFSRAPGVWVQNHLIASYCDECTPSPKMLVQGKYEGNSFLLHIFLEPDPKSDIVEVLDHLKKEVREATEEEIVLYKENELVRFDELPREMFWIPKEEYRKFIEKDKLTNEELVDLFVDKTMYWYTDKSNGLFGWQNCVKEFLNNFLKGNKDFSTLPIPEHVKDSMHIKASLGCRDNMPVELIIVENKFTNEWIGPEGMFSKES